MQKQTSAPATTGKATTVRRREAIRRAVGQEGLLGSTVAMAVLKPLAHADDLRPIVDELMGTTLESFKPRSAAEHMLVEQLVVTHAQLMRAQRRAALAERFEHIDLAARIASRLQDDFRKTLAALREWNAPPRAVIHAQQANVANQQVIQQVQATQEGGQ